MKNKIGMISLGCPKALVDAEKIMTALVKAGYEIVDEYRDADLIVINTCGFINEAIEESMDAIGDALLENGRVIVTGCLGARTEMILEKYPAVLNITGPHQTEAVLKAVENHLPLKGKPIAHILPQHGIKLTPDHYAYLKISEGCNNKCTFCIIPQLRGLYHSRPLVNIETEAKQLVDAGIKELLVISQDTAAYGLDIGYKNGLLDLVNMLSQFDIWIRLHYLYPYPHIDNILPLMAENKIVPYLDVPLQHAHPSVLRLMKRPGDAENLLGRIQHWREICPNVAIRSTFIVGFPGETDDEFEFLLNFLEEAKLDRVGAFKYSPVEGATANTLPNPISEDIKEERLEMLMALQSQISTDNLAQKIGQTIPVLIDEITEDNAIGRSFADAPEIDGEVIIENGVGLKPGDIVDINITDSDDHDLFGKK